MNEEMSIWENVLKKDGLSLALLRNLSYQSDLGIRLKKNLHYFDKDLLFAELLRINRWYDTCEYLHEIPIDYRIKSIQSAMLKYERYYPDHQAAKVFNDMLGFRTFCDNYEDVLRLKACEYIRMADMSGGKAQDDGYRGVQRQAYEDAKIRNEDEFKEVLEYVLSDSKKD